MKICNCVKQITLCVFLPAAACALFVSCATVKKNGTVFDESSFLNCALELRSVEIVADYVRQNDSLEQFTKTAEIMLRTEGLDAGSIPAFLDIHITQRTFLRGVEPKNSLYVLARLFDADNRLFAAFTRAQEGSENIVSAVSQYRQLAFLAGDIAAFRTALQKRVGKKQ